MKDLLEELHVSVTNELLIRVKSGDATPAELSVAVKFLKDNGASNDIVTAESPMASLLTALPFEEATH